MDWGDGQYERTAKVLEPAAFEAVRASKIQWGDRVLDIGCGSGNVSVLAAQAEATVTGVDLSPRLLAAAKRRSISEGLNVSYQVADAQDLPFDNDSFDVAMWLSAHPGTLSLTVPWVVLIDVRGRLFRKEPMKVIPGGGGRGAQG